MSNKEHKFTENATSQSTVTSAHFKYSSLLTLRAVLTPLITVREDKDATKGFFLQLVPGSNSS